VHTPIGRHQLTPLAQAKALRDEALLWWLGPWPLFPGAAAIDPDDCVAAYRAQANDNVTWGPGPDNIAASYINLNDPGTNDAAPVIAPTWAAPTGWGLNGLTQCLDTGVAPGEFYTVVIQYANVTNDGYCIGASTLAGGGRGFALSAQRPGNAVRYYYGNGIYDEPPKMQTGNLALVGGVAGYRNGVLDRAIAGGWADFGSTFFLGARNRDGVAVDHGDGNTLAVGIYKIALDVDQIAALGSAGSGAMANL
jgi:hypothetical protein